MTKIIIFLRDKIAIPCKEARILKEKMSSDQFKHEYINFLAYNDQNLKHINKKEIEIRTHHHKMEQ